MQASARHCRCAAHPCEPHRTPPDRTGIGRCTYCRPGAPGRTIRDGRARPDGEWRANLHARSARSAPRPRCPGALGSPTRPDPRSSSSGGSGRSDAPASPPRRAHARRTWPRVIGPALAGLLLAGCSVTNAPVPVTPKEDVASAPVVRQALPATPTPAVPPASAVASSTPTTETLNFNGGMLRFAGNSETLNRSTISGVAADVPLKPLSSAAPQ